MANRDNTIICRCQDISEQDILDAIELGFDETEPLRKHLHLGMGACQGRVCISMVQKILIQKTGKSIEEIGLPTVRPPASVMPVRILAFKEMGRENK